MKQRVLLIAVAASFVAGVASAQYPILDKIAEKVIQKYQTSTCEQLWQNRGKPGAEEEQKVMGVNHAIQGRVALRLERSAS